VVLEVHGVVSEPVAAEVGLLQLVALEHGAHGAVQHQDTLPQHAFEVEPSAHLNLRAAIAPHSIFISGYTDGMSIVCGDARRASSELPFFAAADGELVGRLSVRRMGQCRRRNLRKYGGALPPFSIPRRGGEVDKKLIVGAVVAGALILGGVGYFAMNQPGGTTATPESPSIPATQLKDELPPVAGGDAGSGDAGSTPQSKE
jgi:hypothetical protein